MSAEEVGKLFVGGLSWETTQENLQRYFGRFGEVVDCVVMKNNETGRSRGFGFITFKDPNCVSIVLSSNPHELDGRTIDPKACNPRGMQKVRSQSDSQKSRRGGNYPKIFLGGLPANATETELRSFFSKYGKVMEVVIMYDQEKKKSRGFGFLSFESEDSIERVCAEHYVTFNGKQVECKRAEPRDMSRGANKGGQSNQGTNQWGGPGMGMTGGPGGWGTPPGPGGPAGGPGMGPGPAGPGPMGPMANGMMPGGYQGGWGNPQQQNPYGPQGGYGTGYQGWPAPSSGFGPYGGPNTQFGQQGYGGYGGTGTPSFGGYSGYTAPMGGGAPAPGGPPGTQPPTDPFQQGGMTPGVNPPAPGQPMGTGSAPPAGAAPNQPSGMMGNYQQDTSGFGPSRGYGGTMDGMSGTQGFSTGFGGGQGDGPHTGGRGGGQTQGYHPYRRV